MGAGRYPAGAGPMGLSPITAPSAPRDVVPPPALYFDGKTRSFPLDANGFYLGIHPVDQAVALALIVTFNTISSAPNTGARFREIKKITKATPNTAKDMAREALDSLIRAQDIQIRDIQVETRTPQGAVLVAVSYVNLRARPVSPRPRTVNVNVG